jgi:hypothetical protein
VADRNFQRGELFNNASGIGYEVSDSRLLQLWEALAFAKPSLLPWPLSQSPR